MRHRAIVLLLVLTPILAGFDLSRHSIPIEDIVSGGPPKDGIPAIIAPRMIRASEAGYLRDTDRVIGVERGGEARAYPLAILNWHEVANDRIGDTPIAVTYCPLTRTSLVYQRRHRGSELEFGVSGRLYQSNLLMYDKATESLWSQITAEAVTGPKLGARLAQVPSVETSWGQWRALHPGTLVLSSDTGHRRDYTVNPYEAYEESQTLIFPVDRRDDRLTAKDFVLGLTDGRESLALPTRLLTDEPPPLAVTLGSTRFLVSYDRESQSVRVARDGVPAAFFTGYWFAWASFHPETKLWRDAKPDPKYRAAEQMERIQRMFAP